MSAFSSIVEAVKAVGTAVLVETMAAIGATLNFAHYHFSPKFLATLGIVLAILIGVLLLPSVRVAADMLTIQFMFKIGGIF